MSAPMTPEQRTEIREAARPGYADILAQLIKHGAHDDPKHGKVIVHGVTVVPAADLKAAVRVVWSGAPTLLAEVERLSEQLAAFAPPGALSPGETPALCGTCKKLLCVPGLPGCARCVKAELAEERARHGELVAEMQRARTAAEDARAEVKRLRAALGIEVRRNSGRRSVPSGAPDSVVRSWAREHNIPTNPKGRVAPDVRAAYEAAWRAEQDGDTDE